MEPERVTGLLRRQRPYRRRLAERLAAFGYSCRAAGRRSGFPGGMGAEALVGALAVAAAAIAVWIDVRVSGIRPRSLGRRMAHAFLAFLLLNLASTVVARSAQPGASVLQREAAIFLLFLPGLLYTFLACVWLLRSLAEIASLVRH